MGLMNSFDSVANGMNTIVGYLNTLYQPDDRVGDCFIDPLRSTVEEWGNLFNEALEDGCELYSISYRIVCAAFMIFQTIAAAIVATIGMILKAPFTATKIYPKQVACLRDAQHTPYRVEDEKTKTLALTGNDTSAQLLQTLPQDTINHILSFLHLRAKLNFAQVSTLFHKWAEVSTAWNPYLSDMNIELPIDSTVNRMQIVQSNADKLPSAFSDVCHNLYGILANEFGYAAVHDIPQAKRMLSLEEARHWTFFPTTLKAFSSLDIPNGLKKAKSRCIRVSYFFDNLCIGECIGFPKVNGQHSLQFMSYIDKDISGNYISKTISFKIDIDMKAVCPSVLTLKQQFAATLV